MVELDDGALERLAARHAPLGHAPRAAPAAAGCGQDPAELGYSPSATSLWAWSCAGPAGKKSDIANPSAAVTANAT